MLSPNPEARMSLSPPFTVEVDGCAPIKGETIPRRNITSKSSLCWQPTANIETVFDIVKYAAAKYGNKKALGSRKLVKKHLEIKKLKKIINGVAQEVDKKWTFFEMSSYEYVSYTEHETLVEKVGSAFRALGMDSSDKVHLFASTSAHWLAIAHGAMSQSMPIVTAYDTLGTEGLRHSLQATRAKAIFLEPHLLKIFFSTFTAETTNYIQIVVYNTECDGELEQVDLTQLIKSYPGLNIMSFDELSKLGEANRVPPVAPKSTDLACVMYTSGSTGTPKGVKLSHGNIIAAVAGVQTQLESSLHSGDSLLAYLPLAHIFEFVLEQIAMFFGVVLGYGSPRTLSDSSMRGCKGDIREFRPSILVGVPAIWEMVKKGIVAKIDGGGPLLRGAFWSAFYAKQFLMQNNLPGSAILDTLVFNKVKEATGGRLRICFTAAAPIAKETQEFISMSIAPVINAYGMTETCGMGAICHPLAWTVSATGAPEPCVEIKLVDFSDAGYFSTNVPRQQGEIWIRGPSVMQGYYHPDEEEEQEEDWKGEGGWFKTGDIGEWDEMGLLRVIDRKKNLVKTLNGEYIALEKLESIYRSSPLVSNICVYASITETHPVAMIVPVEAALKKLANALGVQGDNLESDEKVQGEILKQLQVIGRKSGFASMEILVGVVLADEEWTPVNGLVTATNKLNRRVLSKRYANGIENAYLKSRT